MKYVLSMLISSLALSVVACGGEPAASEPAAESEMVTGQQQDFSADAVAATSALVEVAKGIVFRPNEQSGLKAFLNDGPATTARIVDDQGKREFFFTHGFTSLHLTEMPSTEGPSSFSSILTEQAPPETGRAFARNDLRVFNAIFALVNEQVANAASPNSTQLQRFLKSGVVVVRGSLTPSPSGDITYALVGELQEGDIILPGTAQLTILEHPTSTNPVALSYTAEARIDNE